MSANENIEEAEKKDDKIEVHSANSWENADLGDKSRNEKFLRLMGATKKEHHGRFVIGDQDGKHRAKSDERHMAEELEEQYKHSMEHTLAGGKKGHIGLGFHKEDDKPKDEDEVVENVKSRDAELTEKVDSDIKEKVDSDVKEKVDSDIKEKAEPDNKDGGDRKRESFDNSGPEHEEVKKMKFVKSTS